MEITIDRVECMGTSYYGNPYFKVYLLANENFAWLRTSINAGVNYEITNYRRGDKVNVKLTRAGRIYAIERA
jgi:hypothetical protein